VEPAVFGGDFLMGAGTGAKDVPDHLLTHLSPLVWEHVNLTGDYVWAATEQMTENPDGFRPLRLPADPARLAA
jgi:hypothetical protein